MSSDNSEAKEANAPQREKTALATKKYHTRFLTIIAQNVVIAFIEGYKNSRVTLHLI